MTELQCHVLSGQVDRLRELVNIGAGHAAGALAEIVHCPCRMQVPKVVVLASWHPHHENSEAAVFFEVHGAMRGTIAIRFPRETELRLVEQIVDASAPEDMAHSALSEVANILASHLVGALAAMLDRPLQPSVPVLVPTAGAAALEAVSRVRYSVGAKLGVETEIADLGGRFRVLLVFLPEGP